MERQLIHTEDGSHTLYVPEIKEHFHSIHGAVQESKHVFIENGLQQCPKDELTILEIGFGTGLNALLTLMYKGPKIIHYFGIEKYPLAENEFKRLNYPEQLGENLKGPFLKIHECLWNQAIAIVPGFQLTKVEADLPDFDFSELPPIDLIYFDAFAPDKQPEMWQEAIFAKIAQNTVSGGRFVTYCAKGEVRRALIRCGFKMQRLPGPPGKKEMLSGDKIQ
ncbi:tRNA (5-methylaminomethyl-2-thiouridine)(34)-methyltransferase MnmD [Gaoshiqia sp. Z1-71]|uniref:tRNA (5-methylaminomethyl-2-thiouridine)(34)-methyltransferase MnmD n=1 Tax=Gaoshiqia hydrogeniformans TaxID=3290090 RepID=UPI003BF91DF1